MLDLTYFLTIIALIITLSAEFYVNHNYKKYLKVKSKNKLTGFDAARRVLDENGLDYVKVVMVKGFLTDHYNPSNKTVNLSSNVFNGDSISSISVACHECGHAIQDKDKYIFMNIRAFIFPIVNLSSKIGYFAIMIGFIFGLFHLVTIGIICELLVLLFQIVTLPVEFDASRRALDEIKKLNLLDEIEYRGSKKVLTAAALTYVASVLSTILEIFRLILISKNDDN